MRTDSAESFDLGELKGAAQLEESIAREHGADDSAIGSEHVVTAAEPTRQVVDPVGA